jgi:hypothetical protein
MTSWSGPSLATPRRRCRSTTAPSAETRCGRGWPRASPWPASAKRQANRTRRGVVTTEVVRQVVMQTTLLSDHHPEKEKPSNSWALGEREKGFEPSTSTLARWHSTTELLPQILCALHLSDDAWVVKRSARIREAHRAVAPLVLLHRSPRHARNTEPVRLDAVFVAANFFGIFLTGRHPPAARITDG